MGYNVGMRTTDPLSTLPKTHRGTLQKFKSVGLSTVGDLLQYLPIRYADYSLTSPIASIQSGEIITVQGKVISSRTRYIRRNFTMQEVIITDGTGEMKLLWYNQPYIVTSIAKEGMVLAVAGKAELSGKKLVMKPMEYEIVQQSNVKIQTSNEVQNFRSTTIQDSVLPTSPMLRGASSTQKSASGTWNLKVENARRHTGRIIPIYSQRGGLSTRLIREKIDLVTRSIDWSEIHEWLPSDIVRSHSIMSYPEALRQSHHPNTLQSAQSARRRFAFDELVTLHLSNILVRAEWSRQRRARVFVSDPEVDSKLTSFEQSLPFGLTGSQKSAWSVIRDDMLAPRPMNRFLQGDVGSGKTVIGAFAAYFTHLNGLRTVFMCPTEILAQQHYATLRQLFEGTGVKVELITGSTTKSSSQPKADPPLAEKSKHAKLQPSTYHQSPNIIVGTHALISDKHVFENVGLVIIDEQHRFGVAQRAILKNKSKSKASASPHLLTMTATPIPRTIALTIFGDLDISVLTDMPLGRLPVKTYLAPQVKRPGAYDWIRKQINTTGCQVFIVCPRISDEDDETLENEETKLSIKAVESESEMLKTKIFPDLRIALLHGKMKPSEKNSIMDKFKNREYDILVTTTVVEVGIDIPNATIMVIEGAERYGLAQLHQLRGRVGRGSAQSYCVLFTSDGANESERLSFFAKTTRGMELAEYDFRHRGPGNIYGTAQHGVGELEIANIFDYALVSATQKAAASLASIYSATQYPAIAQRLERYSAHTIAGD